MRITEKDIIGMISRLNKLTGNKPHAYTDGKPNVGTYLLDCAYGGYKLAQIASEGGGERDPLSTGYVSKSALYTAIHSYIRGIEDCIRGESELNQKINAIVKG